MRNISFSSDTGNFTRRDLDDTSKISEDYFGTQKDPNQIPTVKKTRDWIYKNTPDYLNIIKHNKKVIGYAFMLPCNKRLMASFLSKKINEAEMFEDIKKLDLNKRPETIYLCASVLREDYRGKGLATTAFIKAINRITKNTYNPILFYWKYSEEGRSLLKRVAKLTNLELKERID
ncbi:MAG: GNAT family N-acetyltransferase [Candidatus Pacearchaeota archaeon]